MTPGRAETDDSERVRVIRHEASGAPRAVEDSVAVEEPLEIRVITAQGVRTGMAVTMRTPGHDRELAAGFLFTEGILGGSRDVAAIEHAGTTEDSRENVIDVRLADGVPFDAARFTRNVYTSSSCGVCGKTSLEMVRVACASLPSGTRVPEHEVLAALPGRLAEAQSGFARTGGLHATGVFDHHGSLRLIREDVGRHNAMDKAVGRLLLDGALPASGSLALVSGRASFELVQKAALAGIPTLAAVGAPSSLAVELANDLGMNLIAFLRDGRYNVYSPA